MVRNVIILSAVEIPPAVAHTDNVLSLGFVWNASNALNLHYKLVSFDGGQSL